MFWHLGDISRCWQDDGEKITPPFTACPLASPLQGWNMCQAWRSQLGKVQASGQLKFQTLHFWTFPPITLPLWNVSNQLSSSVTDLQLCWPLFLSCSFPLMPVCGSVTGSIRDVLSDPESFHKYLEAGICNWAQIDEPSTSSCPLSKGQRLNKHVSYYIWSW